MTGKETTNKAQITEIVFFDVKNEGNRRQARIVVSPASFEETTASIEMAIRVSFGIAKNHRLVAVQQYWSPEKGTAVFRAGDGQERREFRVNFPKADLLPPWEE